jgi:hypothetical protein
MKWMQRNIVALVVAGTLSVGLAGPASAQVTIQDGLVNVSVGDVTILEDVAVGVAANVVANICGLRISNVAVLARQVDRSGDSVTVCTAGPTSQPVTISQND